jgi:hypothetical protein
MLFFNYLPRAAVYRVIIYQRLLYSYLFRGRCLATALYARIFVFRSSPCTSVPSSSFFVLLHFIRPLPFLLVFSSLTVLLYLPVYILPFILLCIPTLQILHSEPQTTKRINFLPHLHVEDSLADGRNTVLYGLIRDLNTYSVPHKTSWSECASELYRTRDRRLSAKWLPTFEDRKCHVVRVTDPYGRILGFLTRSRYFSIK